MSKPRRRPGKSPHHHHRPRRRRQPDLIGDVRQALHSGGAYQLLTLVSGVLEVADDRKQDPFARARGEPRVGPSRRELIESFVGADLPETTALLTVIAAMVDDEALAELARRELSSRRDRLPVWLTGLTPITVGRTFEMSHVLGDGDNVAIEITTAFGERMTVIVYIDHNLGTLIKDAFVIPEPVDKVTNLFASEADPDTVMRVLDPSAARARVTEAGEMAAMTYPRFETDTWPACRPLVEWVCRQLPPGGDGYVRPEWSAEDRRRLAQRFFASSHAAGLDEEHRDLFDTVLWFGCDYPPGDPMRWSPVAVEMFLIGWLPRKVMADADYLQKAPDLLRAYVRFCHDTQGIRPALTTETLEAIDRWEPQFQDDIGARAPSPWRLELPDALLDDLPSYEEIMLESLARAVGGDDALDELDDRPLPDEPFDWAGVPADVSDDVGEVLSLCDRYCDENLDVEYRTACRRLLARIVTGDPAVFRRRARPETAAAGICWIIGKANRLFAGNVYAKDMLAWFGIKGSASQRATTLLKAAGVDGDAFRFHSALGTPDLLVSTRRAGIIAARDRYRS